MRSGQSSVRTSTWTSWGAIYASTIPEELERRAETGDPEARGEYLAIVTTELRDALERHGGDTSLLADAP